MLIQDEEFESINAKVMADARVITKPEVYSISTKTN